MALGEIKIENFIINKSNELQKLNDLIHDCWFDIKKISINESIFSLIFVLHLDKNKTLIRNYFIFKQYESNGAECILNIRNVRSYKIDDTENVQYYDINRLIFDQKTNIISILTGIPLSISIEVVNLEIDVIITDKVVDTKRILR